MHILPIGLLLSVVLLLAACGGSAAPGGSDSTGASGTAAQTSTSGGDSPSPARETAMAQPGAGSPVVVFTRSGGMLGKTETLVVQGDGLLQVIEGESGGPPAKEGRAQPEQMSKLDAALKSEGWQQLQPSYGQQVPDGYSYTIVAGSKTIATFDGAPMPPVLEDVLNQLNELWQQALQS